MKTLGIDYGRARIGLAIADILVTPIGNISNKNVKNKLLEIIKKHDIKQIVLGLPSGRMGEEVKRFGEWLQFLGLPLIYQNEHLSSFAAEQHIRATKSKETLDSIAACVILTDWLKGENI